MRVRTSLVATILCMAFGGHAQVVWQYESDVSPYGAQAFGMAETHNGDLLINVEQFTEPSNSITQVFRFNPSGELVDDAQFTEPNNWFRGCLFLPDTVNEGFDVFIPRYEPVTGSWFGTRFLTTDNDLNVIEAIEISYPANTRKGGGTSFRDLNQDIISVGARNTSGSFNIFDQLWWVRYSTDGDSLESRVYYGDYFSVVTALSTGSGYSVLCRASDYLGPYPYMTILRFDYEFEYLDGIVLDDITGLVPTTSSLDSASDVLGMALLPNNRVMVSRQFSDIWGPLGTRAYVAVYGPDGDLEHIRYAAQEDVVCKSVLQGFFDLGQGKYLWSYLEGYNSWETSKVHFVTLDAELNILAEVVADGELDNSFLFPHNVLPARDGGAYACGYKGYLGEDLSRAWVVKLAAPVGVEAFAKPNVDVAVFPNPGASFNLSVNGPMVSNGKVQLMDAQGRLVATDQLVFNRAFVGGDQLATGLYHYSVLDREGAVLASGTWIRE